MIVAPAAELPPQLSAPTLTLLVSPPPPSLSLSLALPLSFVSPFLFPQYSTIEQKRAGIHQPSYAGVDDDDEDEQLGRPGEAEECTVS